MKVDLDELNAMVEQRYVRRVVHPAGHLELFNYTEACSYEGVWNETTRQCRGLILDGAGNVVARPFSKFFNHGEPNAPELDLDAPVTVTDKADGSLGILYQLEEDRWAIATRGSFTSDQAIHATKVWQEKYAANWLPPAVATPLFEIVYPSNRIVVDYGNLDDLIFLACLDNETGAPVDDSRIREWPGPSIETHPYATLRAALEAPPRPGQEGLVVFFPELGERVKIKQDDYIAIHRLVFGLTVRRVWEHCAVHELHRAGLGAKTIGITLKLDLGDLEGIIEAAPNGDWMTEMAKIVPEEFLMWAEKTADRLKKEVDVWELTVKARLAKIVAPYQREDIPKYRKEIALAIVKEDAEMKGALFQLLDGKSIRASAWRAARPDHEVYKADDGE